MKSSWKALLSHRKVNRNTSARGGGGGACVCALAHTHTHTKAGPVQTCLMLGFVLTLMSAHCLEGFFLFFVFFFLNKFNLISDTGKTNLKAI